MKIQEKAAALRGCPQPQNSRAAGLCSSQPSPLRSLLKLLFPEWLFKYHAHGLPRIWPKYLSQPGLPTSPAPPQPQERCKETRAGSPRLPLLPQLCWGPERSQRNPKAIDIKGGGYF